MLAPEHPCPDLEKARDNGDASAIAGAMLEFIFQKFEQLRLWNATTQKVPGYTKRYAEIISTRSAQYSCKMQAFSKQVPHELPEWDTETGERCATDRDRSVGVHLFPPG